MIPCFNSSTLGNSNFHRVSIDLKTNYPLHISLFALTFLSLTYREFLFFGLFTLDWNGFGALFLSEWPYSVTLILILLGHEMGHYLPARYYGVKATLPFFIPFPLGPIGTMGAVIQIKEPIPDKKALFDIGIGGPFISLVLSLIAWLIGISMSELVPLDKSINLENYTIFGESIFTYYSNQWILGPFDSLSMDVNIHPLARAAWVGLLITAINMLPFGQLDGGHIIYSLFGERYRNWIHWLFLAFLILAFVHFTWLLWGFLIYYLLKVEHPFIKDSPLGLGRKRIVFGYIMLISLIFIFVPKPIMLGSEIDEPNLFQSIYHFVFKFFREFQS